MSGDFHYPVDEWLNDCAWVAAKHDELAGHAPIDGAVITAYFERKYGPMAAPHQNRVMAAIAYLSRHIEDFNEGLLCIACEGGGMFGRPLLRALRMICTRVPEDQLGTDWPISEVKFMAQAITLLPAESSRI